jgi:superfamily II DNA or RNA helicase
VAGAAAPAPPPDREVAGTAARLGLRDYQHEALRAGVDALGDLTCVQLLVLPTGAGKTLAGLALASWLLPAGFRILWLARSWELLEQAAGDAARHLAEHRRHLRRIGGAGGPLHPDYAYHRMTERGERP